MASGLVKILRTSFVSSEAMDVLSDMWAARRSVKRAKKALTELGQVVDELEAANAEARRHFNLMRGRRR